MAKKPTLYEKALALVSTVRDEGDGIYSIESTSLPGWRYHCYPATPTSHPRCQCDYYRHKAQGVRYYRCTHLLAVRLYLQQRLAEQRPSPKPPSIKSSMYRLETHLKRQEGIRPQGVTLQ